MAVGEGITNAVGAIVGKTVAQQQQEAATKALQDKLTAMLQKNQNFSTGQNSMLNQAQAAAQQRLASRQIPQPYNTAAPYDFAQDRAYTNPTQNLRKLPTGFDKKDVVAPPTSGRPIPPDVVTPYPPRKDDDVYIDYYEHLPDGTIVHHSGGRSTKLPGSGPSTSVAPPPPPVAPDERPITAQPYDPFVPPFGKPINPSPSPLVFPTAPPTSVNPPVNPNTIPDLVAPMPIQPPPVAPPTYVTPAVLPPPVAPPTPVEPPPPPVTPPPVTPPPVTPPPVTPEPAPAPAEPPPAEFDDEIPRFSNARARKMYDLGNRFENPRFNNDRQYLMAMMAEGGLASLPQTNYYKTPDLLQPVNQQPQPTQPVMQPFTRQRVQAVIPNAWDKKAPEPQSHVDPVILDTVTKLSQGITPLEGQNRGGGQGGVAPAPGSGAAQFGGSGFTGASDSGPSTGAASMANKAAAVLGNLGLTSINPQTGAESGLSKAIAQNVNTNYGNEGRNSVAPSSAGPTGPDGGPTGSRASDGGWGGEGRGGSGGGDGGGGAATGGSGGDASGGGDRGTRGGFSAGGYISPKSKKKR